MICYTIPSLSFMMTNIYSVLTCDQYLDQEGKTMHPINQFPIIRHSFLLKVVKMMVMVVVIFGICWLPYHTYFIWSNIDPTINMSTHVQVRTEVFSRLSLSSKSSKINLDDGCLDIETVI